MPLKSTGAPGGRKLAGFRIRDDALPATSARHSRHSGRTIALTRYAPGTPLCPAADVSFG